METAIEKRFDELRDEGFIYNEPVNGKDMSYGEYVAVADELRSTLENKLDGIPFDQKLDVLRDELKCGDDVRIFIDLEPYEDFLSNIYEEEIDGEYYWKLDGDTDQYPEFLVDAYNEYREDVPEPMYLEDEIDY